MLKKIRSKGEKAANWSLKTLLGRQGYEVEAE
jgi:hypothetical protein